MTKAALRLIAGLAVVAGSSPADSLAQVIVPGSVESDSSIITVTGSSTVYMRPTRAVLFVEIASEESAPDLATLANGAARAAVVQALENLGYSERDIDLWGYGAAPATSQGYGPTPRPGTADAFEAKSGLRIVVEPLDRLDAVSTNLLLAGASVTTVVLESDETQQARADAMRIAVESARTQAETMASAAGGRLGRLHSLVNTPDYGSINRRDMRWTQYQGPGSQRVMLMPPDVMITASVTGSWIFISN